MSLSTTDSAPCLSRRHIIKRDRIFSVRLTMRNNCDTRMVPKLMKHHTLQYTSIYNILLLIHTLIVLSLQQLLKQKPWHNESAIHLSNANPARCHKEWQRPTGYIMVTTRYSDPQGSNRHKFLAGSDHPRASETCRHQDNIVGYELQFLLSGVLPVTRSTIERERGCNKIVPVLRGNGTKITPTGDICDQPPGEMSWIRGKLADRVGDPAVLSPEEVVLVTSSGTELLHPRPSQSLNNSSLNYKLQRRLSDAVLPISYRK